MSPGVSMLLTVGPYAKPHVRFTKLHWRVCVGFIAFTIHWYDLEDSILSRLKRL